MAFSCWGLIRTQHFAIFHKSFKPFCLKNLKDEHYTFYLFLFHPHPSKLKVTHQRVSVPSLVNTNTLPTTLCCPVFIPGLNGS